MTASTLPQLIAELRSRDVRLWLDGDELRCKAPKQALTPDLRQQLGERKSELILFLRAAQAMSSSAPPIRPQPRNGHVPLSFAQEGAWFIDQLQPGIPFNISLPTRLRAPLDLGVLEKALNEIVRRHEVLRTTFSSIDGQPVQVAAETLDVPVQVIDLSPLEGEPRLRELLKRAYELACQPFDLARGPLLRLNVIRLGEADHVVLFTVHHAVFDGWSVNVFAREIVALYQAFLAGKRSPLPPLSIQYADYALWQRQLLQGAFLDAELGYWKRQLQNHPSGLNLATDRAQAASQLFRGGTASIVMPRRLADALRTLSRGEEVTLFMLLLAAYKALLARYSGQADIVVGTPIANRNQAEMNGVIGFCVNLLALRTDLSGNPSFRELLAREREVCLGAYSHQELPFGLLVQHLQPDRYASHSPIFQVQFALQTAEAGTAPGPEVGLRWLLDVDRLPDDLVELVKDATPATDHLFLYMGDSGAELTATMQYRADLFSADTIQRFLRHLEQLLEGIAADPDCPILDLPILAEAERRQLLNEWNQPLAEHPPGVGVHHLFEAQVRRTPDVAAVVAGDERLSYEELNRRANQVARYLMSLALPAEARVGICLERSADMIAALLGVLKAGAAYVPLDPAYSRERLTFMLADARVQVLLTQSGVLDFAADSCVQVVELDRAAELLAGQGGENSDVPVADGQLAYVIYTSGSTGRPKGVMVSHRNVVNAFHAWADAYGLRDKRCHLQMASFSFDVFAGDLVRALGSGGTLVLCPRETLLESDKLYELMTREAIDSAEFVPAVVRPLLEYLEENSKSLDFMKLVMVGSDAWYGGELERLRRLCGSQARIVNSYGVAEATIDSTYFEGGVAGTLSAEGLVPIGRPFANSQIYVLDPRLQPAPIGVPGELYIGGAGVSRGYLDRPELTAERFIPHPFSDHPGARLYRTGDRARYLADGNIDFLGRVDNQIKIRGFRIEPGEIEAVLGEHPQVRQALVLAKEEPGGEKRLVAYVVVDDAEEPCETASADPRLRFRSAAPPPTADQLREHLETTLPPYMIPAAFVLLDRFPLTPNGKVDRRALPTPDNLRSTAQEYVAPKTPTEIELCRIWSNVLGVERVGVCDNFFALGGHSLSAARLAARIRSELKLDLPLRSLFEHPTIRGLAPLIDRTLATGVAPEETQVDLALEAVLPDDIAADDALELPALDPKRLLLSGASGFLGAYLLRDLLSETEADVYCLVRAANAAEGASRLRAALEKYELWEDSHQSRIIPVLGDLAEPRLGLSELQFEQLARSIDAIYHNGAWVHFMYPYQVLKPANVAGTVEVLRLASRGRLKPIHYVSTLAVFPPHRWFGGSIDEHFDLEEHAGLQGGYPQSKWVAERLVALASRRGIPVAIYRPGRVTGDSRTGLNSDPPISPDLNTVLKQGRIPRLAGSTPLDMTPVDYVARAIVALSKRPESLGQAFHLCHPRPGAWSDVVESLRAAGFAIEEVDPRRFALDVFQFIQGTPAHALHQFLPMVPAEALQVLQQWREETTDATLTEGEIAAPPPVGRSHVDCRNTLLGLAESDVSCPSASEMLGVYLNYYLRTGQIDPP